jgi:hypothetical protein
MSVKHVAICDNEACGKEIGLTGWVDLKNPSRTDMGITLNYSMPPGWVPLDEYIFCSWDCVAAGAPKVAEQVMARETIEKLGRQGDDGDEDFDDLIGGELGRQKNAFRLPKGAVTKVRPLRVSPPASLPLGGYEPVHQWVDNKTALPPGQHWVVGGQTVGMSSLDSPNIAASDAGSAPNMGSGFSMDITEEGAA